ncbi:hypothetical protein [Micromonospora globispora]|uniref:hypothetical protein n=1 Tax=Micromonospora globispora TaxID=1450148 RepID=UPI000F4D7D58|nr:hypothetical protein [Micromonospora globispora]
MSVDELRTGLARIAATVVPDEDPYDRLMRHARRRRRSRWAGLGALLAALLTTAVVAPATGVGGLGNWLRDPEQGSGYRVTNDWVWRLINSPTRGSLAADGPLLDELTRVFDRNRDEAGMGSALPAVKVLFADDSSGVRQVVVAYHSDTSAALVAKTGELGARPQDLVRAGGISNLPILPFTMVGGGPDGKGQGSRWLLGLAPAGCTVWSAPSATLTAEGAVGRTWRRAATPGYLLLDEQRIRGWWRVECGGTIREEGPVGVRTGELSGRQSAPALDPRATSTGPLSPDDELRQVEQAAVNSYRLLAETAGLPGTPVPVRRWSGRIPGAGVPASIAGPASGVGPAVLQLGTGHDALLALAAANDARRDDTGTLAASRADWALAATAVSSSAGLTAIRLPARAGGHAILTDQLLVAPAQEEAVLVTATGSGAQRAVAPVTNGAAILSLPLGAEVTLRVLNADGKVLDVQALHEPATGERIFNEQLVSTW